ncbi:hypothetical protein J8273_5747 [Carpediemonas membranifera]|uniref:Uncharacterized protein n=1 Tax=Carpediemonas membranifera TaxID=201153 RepID=A0A8J6E980_9EUKA|nr:hypothetical protein J8273_5747 [Carpediemonas membranifera]|eukprot:KAG9392935.1 hypothetical protein J8273_5747 [Carpediemonas membranifera]
MAFNTGWNVVFIKNSPVSPSHFWAVDDVCHIRDPASFNPKTHGETERHSNVSVFSISDLVIDTAGIGISTEMTFL